MLSILSITPGVMAGKSTNYVQENVGKQFIVQLLANVGPPPTGWLGCQTVANYITFFLFDLIVI